MPDHRFTSGDPAIVWQGDCQTVDVGHDLIFGPRRFGKSVFDPGAHLQALVRFAPRRSRRRRSTSAQQPETNA